MVGTSEATAAEALALGGWDAGATPPALARIEKGLLGERGKVKDYTEDDEHRGRMVICSGGDLGKPAIPLLRRYAETCKRTEVKDLVLGALGRQGTDAVSVAKEWQASNDAAKQALAIRLIEMAVRHRTPVQVLEPFVSPLLEKGDAMTVRAAERLLHAADVRGGWSRGGGLPRTQARVARGVREAP